MSAKVAFIVEPEFLQRHWGVRVYLYSLAKVLRRHKWTVDFVFLPRVERRRPPLVPPQRARRVPVLGGVALGRRHAQRGLDGPSRRRVQGRYTGRIDLDADSRTSTAGGDAARLDTSPSSSTTSRSSPTRGWSGGANDCPLARSPGLVFDLIPNLFGVMLDEGKPFNFAHQHEVGFKYYEEFCDQVLTISKATSDAYLDLVRRRRPGGMGPEVITLPPIAPYNSLEEPTRALPADTVGADRVGWLL